MHFANRGRFGMLAVGSLALVGLSIPVATAAEPSSTSQVTGHDDWYAQAYEDTDNGGWLTPQQADVTGPQRAPFGTGSHQITIGQSAVQTELYRTDKYDNVPLSQITRLEYSTFAKPTVGTATRQPTYLRLSVDSDGDGGRDNSLFFFPANNGDASLPTVSGRTGTSRAADRTSTATPAPGSASRQYAAAAPERGAGQQPFRPEPRRRRDRAGHGRRHGGDQDPQTNGEYEVDRVIVGKSNVDTPLRLRPERRDRRGTTQKSPSTPRTTRAGSTRPTTDDDLPELRPGVRPRPGHAPAGAGSLKFSLSNDTDANRVELFRTAQYDGTLLRDVRDAGLQHLPACDRAATPTPQQPVYCR